MKTFRIALALSVATLGLGAGEAFARGQAALVGKPSIANTDNCFIWSSSSVNPGLIQRCTGTGSWMMSVVWDTPTVISGTKVVSVVARQTAANQVNCAATTHRVDGTMVGSALFFPPFATNGTYSTRSVQVTNVPAGAITVVQCTQLNGDARILTLDYNQP